MQSFRGKVLVVDDEAAIRQMLCLALTHAGYHCLEAADTNEAQMQIVNETPDLVLLDWMLPGISGLEYARRLRREKLTQDLPIIMLTARTEEEDKVRGLDSGADDYLTKPFSTRELLARIKALLRRSSPLAVESPVEVDGLALDPVTHRVLAGGQNLALGPTEFRLLHFFMTHPERVHSRERLLNGVWGDNVYVEERTVDVHIRRLRKALIPTGHERLIQTVRGAGYRFSPQL
ncbi:MAG: phosphate regulon transcriptional regulator PhoB [Gammaproteobacteria bacterium]|nr:phosphate regulon transcriptional regulator PhoB [Gammaproteobacteria bacterium]